MRQHGFTLVELMVTVSVAAILIGVALPAFTSFIVSNRLTTQANVFVAHVGYARSEAVSRGESVTISALGTPAVWTNGWTISAADGTVLRQQEALDDLTMTGNTTSIVMAATGFSNAAVTFSMCSIGNTEGRSLQVSLSGQSAVTGTIENCVQNNAGDNQANGNGNTNTSNNGNSGNGNSGNGNSGNGNSGNGN